MGTMTKWVVGIAAAVVFAFLCGWIAGRWDRSTVANARQAAEVRAEILGARAALLDARVAIYSVNFGEATRHLEGARGLLGRAEQRLDRLGRDADVGHVREALATIDDAQRLAGKLDQGANARAGDAARTLADVLEAEPAR